MSIRSIHALIGKLLGVAFTPLLIMVLTVVGVIPSSVAVAAAGNNQCTANINNPHFSTGANGVIVKGQWSCIDVPTTINLSAVGHGFLLWNCPTEPEKSESYLLNNPNCVTKGSNHDDISLTGSGSKSTRTAPPAPQSGAHGSGWWIACATWQSHGPNGTGSMVTTFSNPVQASG
jgi:hypothetical protein